MCWVHMRRNVEKKLDIFVDATKKSKILIDIFDLQIMKVGNFNAAILLFFEKCNWYEGCNQFTPSTNNCLESCNKVIKDEYTLRERLPINRFKIVAMKMVLKWSTDYKNGLKEFHKIPSITLPVWTAAYQWVKMKKNVFMEENDGDVEYLIPSGDNLEFEFDEVANYRDKIFANFDELVIVQHSLWILNEFEGDWKSSTCTCPFFFKNYHCKHSVGMAIRQGLIKPPPKPKNIALGAKTHY